MRNARLTGSKLDADPPTYGVKIPRRITFVFADPASVPVLEYSYLSRAPGPQMSEREGWEVLSREFRVVLDFGAGALDWRGAVRNPGA